MNNAGYPTIIKLLEGINLSDDSGNSESKEDFDFDYEQSDIIKALFKNQDSVIEETYSFQNRMGPINNLFNDMRKSLFNKV